MSHMKKKLFCNQNQKELMDIAVGIKKAAK